MNLTEVKFGGFGGQGVILSGIIIGRAAAIYDDKYATLTQSFGPEARGSACSAAVIISDEPITYPYVTHPDILVVMSQDAYARFSPELKPSGLLLYEEDLVRLDRSPPRQKHYCVPATRFAEQLGRRVVLNIVMVGFFAAITDVVGAEALRRSVEASVPAGTEALNLQAFERGYEYGTKLRTAKSGSTG
ncbi:MAG: 2-oxoacid:acceptor oxidoreductase family protein [Phycisphaerae bacterium]